MTGEDERVIWLVTRGEYSDYRVVCAFASKPEADSFIAKMVSARRGSGWDWRDYNEPVSIPFGVTFEDMQRFCAHINLATKQVVSFDCSSDRGPHEQGLVYNGNDGRPFKLIAYGLTEQLAISEAESLRSQFLDSGYSAYQWNKRNDGASWQHRS